ncbi:ABC transporter ATP-binding protein [Halobacillus sp. A1]|uniref:ABC transporter ATP-binding protein n=1 Tax=Halobacillus sp. A1 TaxID=2880262 RepID=UPI0020A6901F|nr:ABC transporter ATP-binding protein [Halobacillus sp. A1]MCP3029900.1 ABC transporter ATP-binding protein [Halobacillus sp. A1]
MEKVISLNHIAHSFGVETVIKDINIEIDKGVIFGLLGPSGSGKTTLVKIITGILHPTEGSSVVQDTQMPSLKQMKNIGFMAQSDALYVELTAYENIDYFASIYGLPRSERKQRIKKVLEIVDLVKHMKKPVHTFSGGMKRRLSLAISIVHEPEILILDEPTVGIDPLLRQSIWQEFNKLKSEGTTIIVTTHVMDEAEKCDELALLHDGYVIAQGSPKDLKQSIHVDTMEQAFLHYGGGKS